MTKDKPQLCIINYQMMMKWQTLPHTQLIIPLQMPLQFNLSNLINKTKYSNNKLTKLQLKHSPRRY